MAHIQQIWGMYQTSEWSSHRRFSPKKRSFNLCFCNINTDADYLTFLHDRSWKSPWIKLISHPLDITFNVLALVASKLSGNCDVTSNRVWVTSSAERKQSEQETDSMYDDRRFHRHVRIGMSCKKNRIIYVLSWRSVYVLVWCLFPIPK